MVGEVLPPAQPGHERRGAVLALAEVRVPDPLFGADVIAITEAEAAAVFVHVETHEGALGHGRLEPGPARFELRLGTASHAAPELVIDFAGQLDDPRARFVVRDLHDPNYLLATIPAGERDVDPNMSAGPDSWGLIWRHHRWPAKTESLFFAELDPDRRVHARRRLATAALRSGPDIVGTPSGYAIAYVEAGADDVDRLLVLLLAPSGAIERRIVVYEGAAWGPQLASTSSGLTLVFADRLAHMQTLVRLGFDGRLQAPARELPVSGHVHQVAVHRDQPWLAVDQSREEPCVGAFRLGPDGRVTGFALVDESSCEAQLGSLVLGSVHGRLLAAWTTVEAGSDQTRLRVTELLADG